MFCYSQSWAIKLRYKPYSKAQKEMIKIVVLSILNVLNFTHVARRMSCKKQSSDLFQYTWFTFQEKYLEEISSICAGDYIFKVDNGNTKTMSEIFSKIAIDPIQDRLFRDCSLMGAKKLSSLKSVTHIPQWWNLAQIYLT